MQLWLKKHKIAVSIASGLMVACAFPLSTSLFSLSSHISDSFIGLIIGVFTAWLISYLLSFDIEFSPSGSLFGGFLFSSFLCVGCEIYHNQSFPVRFSFVLFILFRVFLLLPLTSSVLSVLFSFLFKQPLKSSLERYSLNKKKGSFLSIFFLIWLFLLICWIPAFLAYYPGIFGYDMHNETHQAFTGIYNSFQPLVYTLFFKFSYWAGMRLFNNATSAVALFLFFQMLILSGMYSLACTFLFRWFSVPRRFIILTVLFYALFPNHAVLSISSTKDALFSGCFLLLTLQLYHLCSQPDAFLCSVPKWMFFIGTVILAVLLRNNLIYAFALLIPFAFLLKRKKLHVIFLLSVSLIAAFSAKELLSSALHAGSGQRVELLSVPIQQVSRVYDLHSSSLSMQEKEEIYQYIPEDVLDLYWPLLSDPVKDNCNIGDGLPSIMGFLKVWAKLFPRYYQDYTDQFLIMTLGYWYPSETWHDIVYSCYDEPDTEESLGYLYTGFMESIIDGVERSSHSSLFYKYYQWFAHENGHESIPILSLFFAPAIPCWIFLFCMCYALASCRCNLLFPPLLSLLMWLTLLLGPCMIVRYSYPFLACVPVYFLATSIYPSPEHTIQDI